MINIMYILPSTNNFKNQNLIIVSVFISNRQEDKMIAH